MTRYLVQELYQTVRDRPFRSAAAALLLLITTVYVCTDQAPIPVAVIGEVDPPSGEPESDEFSDEGGIRLAAVDESQSPAEIRRQQGRERFRDARVVPAISEMSEHEHTERTRVQTVSGQSQPTHSNSQPVWLTGKLLED